ncbi:MAG: hypothetical protein JO111_06585 [Caulobacteraceae bacterium]|nr:hypothetical protein [Caulobacteraceae bacterium]
MRFWSMIISSAALFGLAMAAQAGMTVGLAATKAAPLTLLVLGLSSLGAAVCGAQSAPARVAQRAPRR